ncbi:hypothetical protein L7F22_012721 [Adiantum nelumboides]|nr:hypothetical protein [Adiantum nelumboides]
MAMMASPMTTEFGSLNLDFDSLAISPPAEKLQVRIPDAIRFVYDSSSSSEDEDGAQDVRKSPFRMLFMREEDRSPFACTHRLGCDSTGSDCSECTCSSSNASRPGIMWSEREMLLTEAWERKKKLMLPEELSTLNDCAQPQLLGRSASCIKPLTDTCQPGKLDRSLSDCGQPDNRVLGSRRGSLTDHDFEELKGAIDLGFRFDESGIANLYGTLPALELCRAVAQNFQGSPYDTSKTSSAAGSPAQSFTPSTPSWTVGSPDDDPEEVKERLRHWAQAVACNTKLFDQLLL